MSVEQTKDNGPIVTDKKIDWKYTHKMEVVEFVRRFYRTAFDWRNNGGRESLHEKWNRWERNYHNIYDPYIKAKKEDWQATMFIPETVKNVEVIVSAMFKILMGKRNPLIFEPRELGDELQAEHNTNILKYELDKSNFIVEFYKTLKESGIFGSGFMKFYPEKRYDNRRIKSPVKRGFAGTAKDLLAGKMSSPNDIVGFEEKVETVLTMNRCCAENVHIRDIFLEPNSKDLSRLIHRQHITYAELLNMAKEKLIDGDSVENLKEVTESDKFDEDLRMIKSNLAIDDPKLVRVDYDKQHTVWEYWGPIPRKWTRAGLGMPEDTDAQKEKANEIVSGKMLIASGNYYLDSDVNPLQSMTHPFLQLDYIKCGQTYGKGIAQLIEGLQEEDNEIRNLRVDNVNIIMNKVMVFLENAVRDPNQIVSKPGGLIPLKGNNIDDVRKAIMPVDFPEMAISSYKETNELERQIQEASGANRVTVGTAGASRDTNQTLGGMELLRQAAYDRFSVGAYIIGCDFLKKAALKLMETSYQISDPARLRKILGELPVELLPGVIMANYMTYRPIPPHEMIEMYDLVPADVFSQENKQQKLQSMMSYGQFLSSIFQGYDPKPIAKMLGRLNDFSSEEVTEIMSGIPEGPIPTPLAQGVGVPSISKSTTSQTGEVAPPSANSAMGTPA